MKYLSDLMQEKQSKLFKECDAFFAFNQNQFNEGKKENINYVQLEAGLICNREKQKYLEEELEKIYLDSIKEDIDIHGAEKIIEREYFNNEIQLSMDNEKLVRILSDYKFEKEKIIEVCKECFKKAVDNDWF